VGGSGGVLITEVVVIGITGAAVGTGLGVLAYTVEKQLRCYQQYLRDTADCGQYYTIDYNYDRCMDHAWQSYIR
jgi:hypothetical protein